jgi:rhodanese-related sulfurtransferase
MWNIFALMEFFMKKITIIILFFVGVALVSLLLLYYNQTGNIEQNDKKYIDVTPEEAKTLIDTNPDLIVIDVSPYYNQGHLPGAIHYYLGDGSLDAAIPSLDSNGEYLVYCHVDSVAISGAQRLIDAGFATVYRLEGNYAAWRNAGYPIET